MIDSSAPSDLARPAEIPDLVVPHAVHPFHLVQAPVRGRLIRLGPLADAILSRHADLPTPVKVLGGQALSLVAAMATALKFTGSFSLQIKGDGPVSLFLTDCTDAGALRFTAQLDENQTEELPEDASALLGKGYLAFTVDQGPEMERHQGVVSLEGKTLADMATHYFETSEQHDCSIHLFAQQSEHGWQAGALVLEKIASDGGHAQNDDIPDLSNEDHDDLWETACTFAGTLTAKELFDTELSSQTLINRLFGTLGVNNVTPRPLCFGCRCNRARLVNVLERFSSDDLDHMAHDGSISMDCNFCNVQFRFSREELSQEGHS
ncbi:Hsp33 family molecular chaperone HslO [Saccharibacter sp. 17.LH.SD]|uniref:Hsp33 family molecular chaperone HslO n=1 Tax=Saccharibacter sp. 17.LH.SD TaxID=2689393 RepID=UPI001370B0DA|nr:Hsp33 family molecular chaperone HslO [Saccharibacter sp. 17.LH.SD]